MSKDAIVVRDPLPVPKPPVVCHRCTCAQAFVISHLQLTVCGKDIDKLNALDSWIQRVDLSAARARSIQCSQSANAQFAVEGPPPHPPSHLIITGSSGTIKHILCNFMLAMGSLSSYPRGEYFIHRAASTAQLLAYVEAVYQGSVTSREPFHLLEVNAQSFSAEDLIALWKYAGNPSFVWPISSTVLVIVVLSADEETGRAMLRTCLTLLGYNQSSAVTYPCGESPYPFPSPQHKQYVQGLLDALHYLAKRTISKVTATAVTRLASPL